MGTTSHLFVKAATLLVGVAAGLLLLANNARGQATSSDSRNGLTTYSTATPAGSISLSLPSDIREGDTIRGTIVADPAGSTPAERQKNSDTLNGVIVDFAGKQTPVASSVISIAAPTRGIKLMTVDGTVLVLGKAQHYVPVAPKTWARHSEDKVLQSAIRGLRWSAPSSGQMGRPMMITGLIQLIPLGGIDNVVSFSNVPARTLAESPRAIIVECPKDQPGALELKVTQGGRTVFRAPFQNVGVKLSATKTVLQRNETAIVTVRAEYLPPTEMVPMSLISSPSIQMQGGNVQSIKITPGMAPGGVFETRRQITALTAGSFDVSAMLMTQDPPKEDPLFPGAFDMNGINSFKQLLGIVAAMNADEQERRLRASLKALRQRLSDATDEDTKDWLKEKIKIVEKTMETLGITE